MNHLDTIAAISTPYGKGGIAVLRVSGSEAADVAQKVFVPKSGKKLCVADALGLLGKFNNVSHNILLNNYAL